jgi:hypothetical protein
MMRHRRRAATARRCSASSHYSRPPPAQKAIIQGGSSPSGGPAGMVKVPIEGPRGWCRALNQQGWEPELSGLQALRLDLTSSRSGSWRTGANKGCCRPTQPTLCTPPQDRSPPALWLWRPARECPQGRPAARSRSDDSDEVTGATLKDGETGGTWTGLASCWDSPAAPDWPSRTPLMNAGLSWPRCWLLSGGTNTPSSSRMVSRHTCSSRATGAPAACCFLLTESSASIAFMWLSFCPESPEVAEGPACACTPLSVCISL